MRAIANVPEFNPARGAIATYNGTAWTVGPVAATGGQGLESVSCPTAHLCIAGSFNGDIFSFANGA
jgi:hypothetical protein